MDTIVLSLDAVADKLQSLGKTAAAANVDAATNTLEHMLMEHYAADQSLPTVSYIFPATHSMVNDGKHHFPINNPGRARNAVSRAGAFTAAPKWYDGSLSSFKNAVHKAVSSAIRTRSKKDKAWDIELSKDC